MADVPEIPWLRCEQIAATAKAMRADLADDVARREGQPFNGQIISIALGEMCAQLDALAVMVGSLARHVAELEARNR